jgi:hypothetical protein
MLRGEIAERNAITIGPLKGLSETGCKVMPRNGAFQKPQVHATVDQPHAKVEIFAAELAKREIKAADLEVDRASEGKVTRPAIRGVRRPRPDSLPSTIVDIGQHPSEWQARGCRDDVTESTQAGRRAMGFEVAT